MSADGEQGGVLLPCPFCGGEAYIRHVEAHDHTPMLKALCPNIEPAADTYWPECACGAVKEGCNARADAILAWNTRAAPATDKPDVVRDAANALLTAMTTRALRGRDHVPSMRDEQNAKAALAAALAKHPTSPEDAV